MVSFTISLKNTFKNFLLLVKFHHHNPVMLFVYFSIAWLCCDPTLRYYPLSTGIDYGEAIMLSEKVQRLAVLTSCDLRTWHLLCAMQAVAWFGFRLLSRLALQTAATLRLFFASCMSSLQLTLAMVCSSERACVRR